jgi:hypothetical protein
MDTDQRPTPRKRSRRGPRCIRDGCRRTQAKGYTHCTQVSLLLDALRQQSPPPPQLAPPPPSPPPQSLSVPPLPSLPAAQRLRTAPEEVIPAAQRLAAALFLLRL